MNLKKLTTVQKALLGVVAAGLAVLVYDQFGGPSRADAAADAASTAELPHAEASAPAVTTSPPAAQSSTPDSLGARLRSAAPGDSVPVNDPFARVTPSAGTPASPGASVEAFASKYRMTGAMTSGNSPAAILNGTVVRRGQSVDGLRLVEVTATSATFEARSGERVTLRMGADSDATDGTSAPRRRGRTQ